MTTWDDKPNDYEHALAEIERLRQKVENLMRGGDYIEELENEVKRLRMGLQEIANLDPMTADVLTDDVGPMARAIAIRALKS